MHDSSGYIFLKRPIPEETAIYLIVSLYLTVFQAVMSYAQFSYNCIYKIHLKAKYIQSIPLTNPSQ